MMRLKIILSMVIVFCLTGTAQEVSSDSVLTAIESLYNNGQYLSAELEARRILEEPQLSDTTKAQIEKWIAFSLIAQGKSTAAKERFISVLKIDDAFELDRVLTSPKILSVFNDAKAKFLQQRKNTPMDTSRAVLLPSMEIPHITFRTIVFPGWEQLYQGRTISGYLLMGTGAATLASGIIFETLRAQARTEYLSAVLSSEISSKYDTYNNYRKGAIYSFSAFALIYIASEIDVFSGAQMSIHTSYSHSGGTQLLFKVQF